MTSPISLATGSLFGFGLNMLIVIESLLDLQVESIRVNVVIHSPRAVTRGVVELITDAKTFTIFSLSRSLESEAIEERDFRLEYL